MEVLYWQFRESTTNEHVHPSFSPATHGCPEREADEVPTAPVVPPTPPAAGTAHEDTRGSDTSPAQEGLIRTGLRQETPWLQTAKAY